MDVLRHLHTSVAQTFDTSFDIAYRDLNAQLSLRDAKIEEAEERVKDAEEARLRSVAEAKELKDEIASLRDQMLQNDVGLQEVEVSVERSLQLERAYAPQHVLGSYDGHGGNDPKPCSEKGGYVEDKYVALYREFQTLVKASAGLKSQVKRHKRKLMHWRECLDRDEFTLVVSGTTVKFQRVQERSNANQTQRSMAVSTFPATKTSKLINHKETENPSTSNIPIFGGAGSEIHTNNNVVQPLHALSGFTPTQSSPSSCEELDSSNDTSQSQGNPATQVLKRKRLELLQSPSTVPPSHGDSATGKSKWVAKKEHMSSSPLRTSQCWGASGTQDLDEIGNTVETPTKKKSLGRQNQAYLQIAVQSPPAKQTHNPQAPVGRPKIFKRPTVLQPVDGNLKDIKSDNMKPKKRPARHPESLTKHAFSSIAEDGDECHLEPCTREAKLSQPVLGTQKRLQDLLERPLPPRQSLQGLREAENPENHEAIIKQDLTGTCTADIPPIFASVSTETQENMVPKSPQALVNAPAAQELEMHPEEEPYRARPLHRLELSHFKLNPHYNQGLDFAFDTVVRKRDERKCIHGCTRRDCCGEKFLAMARLGGLPTDQSTTRQEGDPKILEEYLGEDKHLVDRLDETDYQNLLDEAKARLIADRFGKHRHHHQRPTTPPGFWRTDMPDTQELEHDREKASKLEREKVKQRYREAMRSGGLWKFADE